MGVCKELWALVDDGGAVLWSRGGSSTSCKLMVYPTEKAANMAIRFTRHHKGPVIVKKIYEGGVAQSGSATGS